MDYEYKLRTYEWLRKTKDKIMKLKYAWKHYCN
jgi:hypothetical protein